MYEAKAEADHHHASQLIHQQRQVQLFCAQQRNRLFHRWQQMEEEHLEGREPRNPYEVVTLSWHYQLLIATINAERHSQVWWILLLLMSRCYRWAHRHEFPHPCLHQKTCKVRFSSYSRCSKIQSTNHRVSYVVKDWNATAYAILIQGQWRMRVL